MVDFQKDETKLRAKAKKGTITDEEFFKEIKRLHKRATESIVIEDNKICGIKNKDTAEVRTQNFITLFYHYIVPYFIKAKP